MFCSSLLKLQKITFLFFFKGEQLIGRYKTQIELYAEALAKALEVEVGEKLIYSFALEKIVKL